MATDIPAIIIAAGHSKRLGRPKAFVEIAGKTLLQHTIFKLQSMNCDPIVVVTNKDGLFDATMQSSGAKVSLNKNPENGRTGSIQVGLSSLLDEIGRMPKKVILAPVDRPGWGVESIVKLSLSEVSSCLSSNGYNGHPVLLVGDDLQSLLVADKATPLRDIISFERLQVDEPLLGLNIDTKEDLEILQSNSDFFETS
jgi:CTP:molybdopterin cytidylyltransferase MocA